MTDPLSPEFRARFVAALKNVYGLDPARALELLIEFVYPGDLPRSVGETPEDAAYFAAHKAGLLPRWYHIYSCRDDPSDLPPGGEGTFWEEVLDFLRELYEVDEGELAERYSLFRDYLQEWGDYHAERRTPANPARGLNVYHLEPREVAHAIANEGDEVYDDYRPHLKPRDPQDPTAGRQTP